MSLSVRSSAPASDSLGLYLGEISAFPILTPEEECVLGARARAGDEDAIDALVRGNLRFVVSVAKKYQNRGLSLLDLINEGNLGLMRAARRFDERRGVRFISYAVWWVRQALLQAVADQGRLIRIPLHHAGKLARLGREARRLEQELGRVPTRDEVAGESALSARELASTAAMMQTYLSLDAPSGDGATSHLLDVTADHHVPPADVEVVAAALDDTVAAALSTLPPRDATILRLYFGFEDGEPLTLEEIGARLGITRERVRQIKEKALTKVRRGQHGEALAAFTA